MNIRTLTLALVMLAVCFAAARAQEAEASPRLQKVLDDAVRVALERFKDKGLAEKNLAVTVVDVTSAGAFERAASAARSRYTRRASSSSSTLRPRTVGWRTSA